MPPLNQIRFLVPKHLAKFVGKEVTPEAKIAAARGAVPLPPKDLCVVLFYLAHDADPNVKQSAEKTLINMPEPLAKSVLDAKDAHPLIIDFFARRLPPESAILETISLNPITHDQTIEFLAAIPSKKVIDIIANNQTRILRHLGIIDILGNNPLCGQATIDRILHFIQLETGLKKAGEPPPPPPPRVDGIPEEQALPPPPEYDRDVEYPWSDPNQEETNNWSMVDLPPELMEDTDEEITDEKHANVTQLISKMGISEKVKMAMMGNKEARGILIKDSNKIVAGAVLSSPKLTDQEIEGISKSRSVSEDIIRQITVNPEWTRNYNIKLNLVNNSKTPLQISMRYLNFLQERDLKNLSKSKNVPGPVAGAAKKLIQKRNEKPKKKE